MRIENSSPGARPSIEKRFEAFECGEGDRTSGTRRTGFFTTIMRPVTELTVLVMTHNPSLKFRIHFPFYSGLLQVLFLILASSHLPHREKEKQMVGESVETVMIRHAAGYMVLVAPP